MGGHAGIALVQTMGGGLAGEEQAQAAVGVAVEDGQFVRQQPPAPVHQCRAQRALARTRWRRQDGGTAIALDHGRVQQEVVKGVGRHAPVHRPFHQRKGLRRLEVDQRVIVFDMNGDHVIPISEIAEVLPYRGVKEAFPRDNPFRGIMTHRNRAIPVVDLAQHLGLPRQKLNTSSNVLVVHLENQPIGLAVGCLRSIEQANWSPEVPVLGAARTERSGVNKLTKKLAEVLVGNERKLLEIISAREEAQRFAECHLAARCDQTALSPEQEKQLECTHTAEA